MKEKIKSKTIIVVRHGESSFNQQGIIQGNTDESILTEKGIRQCEYIGNWLKELKIDKFYSSSLRRAKQSSEIVSKNCGFNLEEISYDNRLEEIDFGSWKGNKRAWVKASFPKEYNSWRRRPYELNIDNKYPVKDLYDRIQSFLKDEILSNESGLYVVLGHRGTVSAIINILLKLPKSHHHFLQIDRGSISVVQERITEPNSNNYELTFANELPVTNESIVDFKTEERTKSYGELFLIRHGQTDSNINKEYQGSKDVSLSSLGIKNMNSLASSFKPKYPTRIICSPLKRAWESAKIVAGRNNTISISKRRDLHEIVYGVWEGMTEEEVIKNRYSEYYMWKTAPDNVKIPNAEALLNAYNRCSKIWDEYQIDIKHWEGSIISVAHDIVNRLIICNALDLPAKYIWCFKQTNASVSILAIKDIYDGRLRMLNHSNNSLKVRLSDEWL